MQYKVEMKYFYGWDDAGWTEETDEAGTLLRFETVQQAQAELADLFANVKAAVASGDMDIEENPKDYRIVEVSA
jgi:NTP pyrophosphatase (non-canonical NTP hydrolase)